MKVYVMHPCETEWREYQLVDDLPFGECGPFYLIPPQPRSFVNCNFDKETKTMTVNWSFSYGMITKDAPVAKLEGSGYDMPESFKTIPDALYYVIHDKGGVHWVAVVE